VQQHWKHAVGYGTVGLEFALSILVGLLGGQWLDKKLGTGGWLTLIGAAFGLAAGCRSVWRTFKRAQRDLKKQQRADEEAKRQFHERPYDPK
jgi:F0F1-type ATP synthase assembly protein I